jgi:hypothetical protein
MRGNNNKQGEPPFALSRWGPYKKNDNAHVEQKNDDKVRKLVGYWRYDIQEGLELLNLLYPIVVSLSNHERADMVDNFFIPSARLMEEITDDKGRVIRRVHDKPKAPYQRLMECKQISNKVKLELKRIYNSVDMIELRHEINKIMKKLYEIQLMRSRKINMI